MATLGQERSVRFVQYIEKAQIVGHFGKDYLHRCIVWLTATAVSICSLLYGALMLNTPPKVEISISTDNRFSLSTQTDAYMRLTVVLHLPISTLLSSVLTKARYGVEINGQMNNCTSPLDSSTQAISRPQLPVAVKERSELRANQFPYLSTNDKDRHLSYLHLLQGTCKYAEDIESNGDAIIQEADNGNRPNGKSGGTITQEADNGNRPNVKGGGTITQEADNGNRPYGKGGGTITQEADNGNRPYRKGGVTITQEADNGNRPYGKVGGTITQEADNGNRPYGKGGVTITQEADNGNRPYGKGGGTITQEADNGQRSNGKGGKAIIQETDASNRPNGNDGGAITQEADNGNNKDTVDVTRQEVKHDIIYGFTGHELKNKHVNDVNGQMEDIGKTKDSAKQVLDKAYKQIEKSIFIRFAYQTENIQNLLFIYSDDGKEIVVDENPKTMKQTDCHFYERKDQSITRDNKDYKSPSNYPKDIPSVAQCPSYRNSVSSFKPQSKLINPYDTTQESESFTNLSCSSSTSVNDIISGDDLSSKSILQDVQIPRGRRMKNSVARRRRHSYPFTRYSQLKSFHIISLDDELRMQMNVYFVSKQYASTPSIVWRSMHPLVEDKVRRLDENT